MNRRAILWTTGIIVAQGLGLAVVALLAARNNSENNHIAQGQHFADVRQAASTGVAFTVNGQPVPANRFLELRAQNQQIKKDTESVLARVVPNDDPSLRYSSHDVRDQEATIPDKMAFNWKTNKTLYDNHKIDAIVLTVLIHEYGAYALAVEAGHTMSQDEIDQEVAKYKAAYELQKEHGGTQILQPHPTTGEMVKTYIAKGVEWLAYVDVLGNKYWDELLPEQVRREGIAAKWRLAAIEGIDDPEEATRIIQDLSKNALHELEIEFTGNIDIDATLDDAIKYQEHWERSHQQQPDNPPIAVPK